MSNQKLLGHVYLIQVCLQLGSSNINALYFFQIRILPWTGAKAEADSLKVELELKSERNQELQKRLNQAMQNIEKIARERDSLQNSLQKAESEEEKVKNAVVKLGAGELAKLLIPRTKGNLASSLLIAF